MTKISGFSIIIPNFNGSLYIKDCINSLINSAKLASELNLEIIFIDNGSKDNSIVEFTQIAENNQLNYRIIKNCKNIGFATAVNQGIVDSKYDWVILLNNDIVFDQNWFHIIIKEFKNIEDKRIAAVFGTVLNKTGDKIESQGLKFFYTGKAQNISNDKPFNKSSISDLKTEIVWGASAALVIYKKDILQKINLFDDDFFAYEEDVDLALRLHNLKFKTLYIPQAISYHLGGGTSKRMGNFRNIMDSKNWIYIIIKNFSCKELFKYFFGIIEERLRNFSGLIKATVSIYKIKSIYMLPLSIFRSYGEVLIKLPKMIRKRRQIKKLMSLDKLQ